MKSIKILILGASGMLGHKMFEVLSNYSQYDVYGTCTSLKSFNNHLPSIYKRKILAHVFADKIETVEKAIKKIQPDVVINCIGMIKQKKDQSSQVQNIILNSLFPHQVNLLSQNIKFKLITIATDCVFDGKKGTAYVETDAPTCHDVYGMTKYLGEIHDGPNLTLRTSIIGHELKTGVSLLDWFLSQENKKVKGYTQAIFSGFPTVILAKIIAEKIIPQEELKGLYHISAAPISKYDLLRLVKKVFNKKIKITPSSQVKINRSLDSQRLRKKIKFTPSPWNELIEIMHEDYNNSPFYK